MDDSGVEADVFGKLRDDAGAPAPLRGGASGRPWQQTLKHGWRLRFLLALVALGVLQHTIDPSVAYISNTFFASEHGGGDCELTPKSDPCRRGAADNALYRGWAGAASHAGAMVLAVSLGLHSDAVGRRPLIRFHGVLTVLPLASLALHVEAGLSLWLYLLVNPLVLMFDVNGVFLALLSDLVPEHEERAGAYGALIGCVMIVFLVFTPIAFKLPRRNALAVSVVAAAAKMVYLFAYFPETAANPRAKGAPKQRPPGLLQTARQAFGVLTRHRFISRMVAVLTLSGLGASGYAIVMPPFLEGYLGLDREDKLALFAGAGLSAMLTLLLLLRPTVARFGEVGVLQISTGASVLFPVLCPACSEVWHVVLLSAVLAGPLLASVPVVSAIKSNVVAADEQGLVQGAIASIGKGTATVGFLVFGYLFQGATRGGELRSRTSVLPPFLAIGGVSLLALLAAMSLRGLPRPPPLEAPAAPDDAAALELAGLQPGALAKAACALPGGMSLPSAPAAGGQSY